MAQRGELDVLLNDTRLNSVLSWVLLGFVGLVGVESLLDGDWAWVTVAALVLVLGVIPPIAYRNPRVMLPWEVLVLTVLPLLGRGLIASGAIGDVATYLSVAAIALVIAVELDVFTPVMMTTWFAVLFVVVVTMAAAGGWAVIQWLSDLYLGTTLLYPNPPPVSPAVDQAALEALMWDFVAATVTGALAGVIFALYFRRVAPTRVRLPDEVEEVLE
ncbi:MAG: hypothetical protein ABEI31_07365 [Halodesulfurarchaeum sp.]